MVSIEITDELAAVLDAAARRAGLSKEELAEDILSTHIEDVALPPSAFTEQQLSRLKESVEQVKRGDVVTSEQVDAFFEDWFKELNAR
jgi:hypothetical protein